ncbi:MAG TPA: amidase [Myxococcota bacterium]|nr:amidase [Myxococcota bacterium]
MLTRRGFLGVALAGAAAGAAASPLGAASAPFDLEEATFAGLRRRRSRELVDQYLARIRALDPTLRAIIEIDPDAPAQADARDREPPRGPLHGLPILLKDNVATADRTTTTAGSLALEGSIPPRDAELVARLRAAGAVLLGKANMSEWANFRDRQSTSGWSARGGQCRNPYALDRTPSGSSSGSAVAVAANLCAAAVGTETDGSITSPAAACALVGVKPTVGLVSQSGIVPIAHSQDAAGPLARTVADAAALLGVLAGETYALDAGALKGARLGVPRKGYTGYSREADAVLETAIALMKERGAEIVDPAEIATAGKWDDAEFDVLLYEINVDLPAYLAWAGAPVRTIADIVAFNEKNADRELVHFGQDILTAKPPSRARYDKARASALALARKGGIDATMDKYRLDALVAPTQAPPSPIDLVNGDHWTGGAMGAAAVAGYPSVTVPAGWAYGLPIGLLFFGRARAEARLLNLAYAFEQARRARRVPYLLATAAERPGAEPAPRPAVPAP